MSWAFCFLPKINASWSSCWLCIVISPFEHVGSELVPFQTRPAKPLFPAKVLDISAFRLLQFCAGFGCLLGPWNETIEESDLIQNGDSKAGLLSLQVTQELLGHPKTGSTGALPNESLDFKALNRAFSPPSRSLSGGGAVGKRLSIRFGLLQHLCMIM